MCGYESQVRLVALALVDPGRREFSCGRGQRRGCHSAFPGSCLILPEQVCDGSLRAASALAPQVRHSRSRCFTRERSHASIGNWMSLNSGIIGI
jgi:hypothetical protein